ncbi:MAG: hypothetical protein ACLQQ4_03530 [Bacteroidia bacterium]
MKKSLSPLVVLAILAISFLAACKSSESCAAYKDSRANTQQTIQQYHSKG